MAHSETSVQHARDTDVNVSAPGSATPDPPAHVRNAPFVSAGRKIHNEITYRGIDWGLNAAVGVTFTYGTERTQIGQRYFSKPLNNIFKKILKPFFKSEAALAQGAKGGSMFVSIMAGGTTIIPLMMAMENKENKKVLIKALDEKIYGKEVVAGDPRFAESYHAIDEEPKKDFSTGMGARVLSLAPLLAMSATPAIDSQLTKKLYLPIARFTKKAAEHLHIQPKKLMEAGKMELADGDITKAPQFVSDWDFIHRTIGFDFGLTAFYSVLHEMSYKCLSALRYGKEHNHQKEAATAEPAAAIHAQASAPVAMSSAETPRYASMISPSTRTIAPSKPLDTTPGKFMNFRDMAEKSSPGSREMA